MKIKILAMMFVEESRRSMLKKSIGFYEILVENQIKINGRNHTREQQDNLSIPIHFWQSEDQNGPLHMK